MPEERIAGWDIGGAHLKAATVTRTGNVLDAIEIACPLWQGLEVLGHALATARRRLGPATRHAVTMTGELADIFTDRADGVRRILDAALPPLSRSAPAQSPAPDILIYAGGRNFLDPATAGTQTAKVASANWQATVTLACDRIGSGLMVDIGSTTTDIIPFLDGEPRSRGLDDHQRLRSGDLIYSGVVRTPLIALARNIPFEDASVGLMAETFATTADIYRLLEQLPPDSDLMPTADGAGKTATESMRRLARMIGLDAAERPNTAWRDLARTFADIQAGHLRAACQKRAEQEGLDPAAPVIGAGCGCFLARRIAEQMNRPYTGIETLVGAEDSDLAVRAAVCAPAVAVACLAALEPAV